jgi:hypothetical protein
MFRSRLRRSFEVSLIGWITKLTVWRSELVVSYISDRPTVWRSELVSYISDRPTVWRSELVSYNSRGKSTWGTAWSDWRLRTVFE